MKQGWEIKQLGDVCDLQNGYAFKSKWYVDNSNTLNIRMSNIRPDGTFNPEHNIKFLPDKYAKEYAQFLLNEGDLVIAMTDMAGDPKILGVPTLVKHQNGRNFLLNQRVGKLNQFHSDVFVPYLRHYLSSPIIKEFYKSLGAGGLQINISKKQILSAQIPFPPLDEQKRIVAKLDECLEAIDKARANMEKNLNNAKELFQSKLNEIFSQKGDDWVEMKLGEVAKYDKTKNTNSQLPYVGLEHIESNSGKFIGSCEPNQVKSSTFHFNSKHILYGRLRPYLNKVLIPDFEGHCSTEIFPILVNELIKREYLFYWFISGNTVKKIDSTWTGARMPRANMNEVIEFQLPIPSIEKQNQIVQQLESIKTQTQALESNYQKELDTLDELKKSILQKAFNGEL